MSRGSSVTTWARALTGAVPASRVALAAVVLAVATGCTYAVPATRAAMDDVLGEVSGWIGGDDASAPGRAVIPGEDLPAWLQAEDGEKRVLAQAAGQKLVAVRHDDTLTLALASYATSGTIDEMRGLLSGHRMQIVGPGDFVLNGRHDRRPLFGLVSAAVTTVQLNYDDGPPASTDNPRGAFGLVIDTTRRPASLTGYDRAGKLVARLDFARSPQDLAPGETLGDFRYCPDAGTGCPPWPGERTEGQ